MASAPKIPWHGVLTAIQPRIRLTRSFDERQHSYLGYTLAMSGLRGDEDSRFIVAIGKGAQAKHIFRIGDDVSGRSVPVADEKLEVAELYKTSALKLVARDERMPCTSPPFLGVPPALETYRARGHRRLDPQTYTAACTTCIWGCRMPVEIFVDQWDHARRQHRFETFCYGPKSCPSYKAGSTRTVQGRKKGMVYTEEDWVDEDATAHRGRDE